MFFFKNAHKIVILRACDFFDLFVFFAPDQMLFNPLQKGVILPAPARRGSEAPRTSIASQRVYGAESKDPGDACWQVLFGAFRPQTTREIKKVTASQDDAFLEGTKQHLVGCKKHEKIEKVTGSQDDDFVGELEIKLIGYPENQPQIQHHVPGESS